MYNERDDDRANEGGDDGNVGDGRAHAAEKQAAEPASEQTGYDCAEPAVGQASRDNRIGNESDDRCNGESHEHAEEIEREPHGRDERGEQNERNNESSSGHSVLHECQTRTWRFARHAPCKVRATSDAFSACKNRNALIVWRRRLHLMKHSALALRHILFGGVLALAMLGGSEAIAIDPDAVEVRASAVKGSDMPKITAKAVLSQPPAKVWGIISDCAKYKGRMPRVAAAKELKKEGNKHTCEVTVEVPFPFSNLTAVTEAVHEEGPDGMSRRWKLVRGDYKRNEGSWEIKPVEGGKKSLVTYSLHVEPNTSLPASILEAAQKKAIPDMFVRLEKEAAKL